MRGRREGSRLRFQRLWNSFQAIWKAMKVLPVPVASVSRMRVLVGGDRLHDPLDGDVLVVAARVRAALVFEGHGGEAVAPGVGLGEGQRPELVRRGVGLDLAFLAGLHVDAVDALAVGGVGEAHGQLAGVVLGLADALGQLLVPGLGLDDRQLAVAIDQHVVGDERLAAGGHDPRCGPARSGYSRRIRLPSTTPQPAAASAGSMCSALVSASFTPPRVPSWPAKAW